MNHNDRINLSTRHEIEVLKVIDMANAVAMYLNQGMLPDSLEDGDIFDDIQVPNGERHASTDPISEFLLDHFSEDIDPEEVMERLNEPENSHLLGFYLQVASPMIRNYRFSWGTTRLQWIYGDTYEEAFTAACEWAKEMGHDYD